MLTQRSLDVLLSCVDLRQELLEELEASSEPQQSLCGRVAHQGDVVLDFVQHDGLERGKAPRVRHQFLVNFLHGAETGRNVATTQKHLASKRSTKSWRQVSFHAEWRRFVDKDHTYLDVSNKIHFNWCKNCGSQLVWGEKIFDHFLFFF